MPETKEPAKPATGKKAEEKAPMEHKIAPMVASPTGPQPLSAITNDPERAEEIKKERAEQLEAEEEGMKGSFDELTEEDLEGLSRSEIRAVARDRGKGYEEVRSAEGFLAAQGEDTRFGGKKK